LVVFEVSSETFETSETYETYVSETYLYDSKRQKANSNVSE